jgi:hypothetical protein
MHPNGVAAVPEIPQSFSTVHSFAQGQVPKLPANADSPLQVRIGIASEIQAGCLGDVGSSSTGHK